MVLAVVVVASIGLPRTGRCEARGTLVDLVLDGPLALVVLLGTLARSSTTGGSFAIGAARTRRGDRVAVAAGRPGST